jgi:hypothetical protein
MDILRARSDVPYVRMVNDSNRLVILPGEDKEGTTAIGRPIGKEYYDVESKLRYMDMHGIQTSCISLANPWLDFLEGQEAESVAQELNDELQSICEASGGRLYGFATLPVRNPQASIREIRRLESLSAIKGVILGTPGAGKGLDHADIRDVLGEIESHELLIFLHPHYGIGNEHFHDSGHSLFLALGFPFETTVCVSRMIVSGALDQLPNLKVSALCGNCAYVPFFVYLSPVLVLLLKLQFRFQSCLIPQNCVFFPSLSYRFRDISALSIMLILTHMLATSVVGSSCGGRFTCVSRTPR